MSAIPERPGDRVRFRKRIRDRAPRTRTLLEIKGLGRGPAPRTEREKDLGARLLRTLLIVVGVATVFGTLAAIDPDVSRVIDFPKRLAGWLG